ncbi:MAG: ABC transporter permease subunit [Inquilinus limosus]|uniref:ABC transporter permease subunit n=1 Tax=Inquilinus limosus TaxID=171674 RepID=A0A952FIU0_9PROT|nr:ABC transporter permease subunit [Inquilinus limosus]
MTVFGHRIPMMASLILWAMVWEVVGRLGLVLLFPPFTGVVAALFTVVPTQTFLDAAVITVVSFVLGMALAIAVGVPLGALMGRFTAVDQFAGMWVNLFVSAPLSALVPVIMLLFGMGTATVVVTVFLFAVWIIALDTRAGIRHVPPSLVEMAHSFGATRWQTASRILLLAALPEILAGIRVGLIRGVKGVVVGQLLVSIIGFGALFELYSRNFLMAEFWALTLILFAFALLLSGLVSRLEHRIAYYAGVRQS